MAKYHTLAQRAPLLTLTLKLSSRPSTTEPRSQAPFYLRLQLASHCRSQPGSHKNSEKGLSDYFNVPLSRIKEMVEFLEEVGLLPTKT
jgi:hypothetical protein